ncbi:hypothetical protein RCL1_008775 [Eukaryota sp. TZLM3-RCL]
MKLVSGKIETDDLYYQFVTKVCQCLISFIAPSGGPLIQSANGALLELVVALALVLIRVRFQNIKAVNLFNYLTKIFGGKLTIVRDHNLNVDVDPFVSCDRSSSSESFSKEFIVFCGASVKGADLYIPTADGDWIRVEVKLRRGYLSEQNLVSKFPDDKLKSSLLFFMGNTNFSSSHFNVFSCPHFFDVAPHPTFLDVFCGTFFQNNFICFDPLYHVIKSNQKTVFVCTDELKNFFSKFDYGISDIKFVTPKNLEGQAIGASLFSLTLDSEYNIVIKRFT